jgi:DNA-binding NarL/FixJ family response regulator
MGKPENQPTRMDGLQETLEDLLAQIHAYERALPADNYPARAVTATLGELAQRALNEVHAMVELNEVDTSTPHPFTPREHQVLQLAAQGLVNKEIAYRLGISDRTVQFHMNSIFNKTTTHSRTEAVAVALGSNWISPPHKT